jgi:hypothetical protein
MLPGTTFGEIRYGAGAALAMPGDTYIWSEGYFGANLAVNADHPGVVPEPATFTLIGAAGLLILWSRRSSIVRR